MLGQKRTGACKNIILISAQGLPQIRLLASHAAHAWGRQQGWAVIAVIIGMGAGGAAGKAHGLRKGRLASNWGCVRS